MKRRGDDMDWDWGCGDKEWEGGEKEGFKISIFSFMTK